MCQHLVDVELTSPPMALMLYSELGPGHTVARLDILPRLVYRFNLPGRKAGGAPSMVEAGSKPPRRCDAVLDPLPAG